MFQNSGVKVITNGKRHLGVVTGTGEFKGVYVKNVVKGWVTEIMTQ